MISSSNVALEQASRSAQMSDIVMLDACRLSNAIASRELSCCEVMEAYLDHVGRLNPLANAIVSLRDRERLIAEACELAVDLVTAPGARLRRPSVGSDLERTHVPAHGRAVSPRIRRSLVSGACVGVVGGAAV